MQMSKLNTFYLLLSSLIFLFGCGGNEDEVIPLVEVRVNNINIYQTAYNSLLSISGSAIIADEGYGGNGIIVFRVGPDEFKAYDCTCTHEIEEGCGVIIDENNVAGAVCPCCHSEYELIYGTATKGPAKSSLKQYHVYFNDPYITIRN